MDKYEFQIKTEQLEKQLDRKNYETAAKIADSIDWRKVRNVGLLMEVAEAYEGCGRFEDCYEILNIAYDCAPIGRMIVYKMAEIAVRMEDYNEAVELYKEFVKIAPHDLGRYVLKYKIYKGRGAALEDQIAILEEYKSREYQEQWAYELAELYYQDGQLSKCVEECDDLILWFSEGEYVRKAMELKRKIQPLTASQEEKYRQMVGEERARSIEIKTVNMEDRFNTVNLQAALAAGVQDYIEEEKHQEEQAEELTPEEPKAEAPRADAVPEEAPEVREAQQFEDLDPDKLLREKKEPSEPVRPSGFLGQTDTGQITFDPDESVVEKQITGQMSIKDVLNTWEEKKRETEAAIAEAAKRDEARKKERERLRATGQLPDLNIEVKQTVPEEVLRLIEEIEGRYPYKVHVDPIERSAAPRQTVPEAKAAAEPKPEVTVVEKAEPEKPVETEKEPQEILEILEAPSEAETEEKSEGSVETVKEPQEILEILEAPSEADTKNEQTRTIAEAPMTETEETEPEPVEAESVSPMLDDLEKDLEETVATLPSGQLSEEQKKLFAYFTSVRGMNQQLAALLEEDRMRKERRDDSLLGNIVITGESGNGKTTLAADIVKALQKQRRIKGAKMAKVPADNLNGKNVSGVIQKLGGGALLIEKAGALKTETAVQLSHAMTRRTGGLLVILEDEKDEIRKLFIRCESLGAKFTRTIDIPVFTNKELVAFGESYALEQECVLDEMAVLALYNRIGNNQTSDHLVNVAEVKEMVDEAIDRGGKKGLFGKVKKSRLDEFGHTILLEKDFEI
ncbi:hypothetical protein [Laedolimicola intestinihominis]|uniref:AAA+ ATPase domain-containing protein n=1 Tax=Laedolimicola intestinihominis TaxID=3133166 RepID=A0ABV1FIX8_9FIRM